MGGSRRIRAVHATAARGTATLPMCLGARAEQRGDGGRSGRRATRCASAGGPRQSGTEH